MSSASSKCEEQQQLKDRRSDDGQRGSELSPLLDSSCVCVSPFCSHWDKGADDFYVLRVRKDAVDLVHQKSAWLFPLGTVDESCDGSLRMMVKRMVERTIREAVVEGTVSGERGLSDGHINDDAGKVFAYLERVAVSG